MNKNTYEKGLSFFMFHFLLRFVSFFDFSLHPQNNVTVHEIEGVQHIIDVMPCMTHYYWVRVN